ncbi:MAG: hypothetical protein LM580_10815 [Thermofilum sp.]|nr:hypothetical protein [Thermofilum sp.]
MGQEKRAEVRVERVRVLTPPMLAIVIALSLVSALFNVWYWTLSTRNGSFHGWFIGPVYMALIFELLGRLNPRFRLNAAQQFLIILAVWWGAGKAFLVNGIGGGENLAGAISHAYSYMVNALRDPSYRRWAWDLTPSFIAPKDLVEIEKISRGLMPGETINWAPWIAPIAFWTLWMVVTTLICIVFAYAVVCPRTVEVDRLIYPQSVPLTVLLTNSGTWIESGGKARTKLLDLADPRIKTFWISFVIGFALLGMIPVLTEIMPALPLPAWEWGIVDLPFNAWFQTQNFLPGAYTFARVLMNGAIVFVLLPYDALITGVLGWLIFWVLYPTIGVRLGLLPYQPGAPEGSDGFYGWRAPLPLRAFSDYGLLFGVALLTLWQAKDTVRAALRGEAAGGLPVKHLLYMFAALTVVWIAMWTAAGGHPLTILAVFIFFMLWQIAITRYMAELWWQVPTALYNVYHVYTWPFGAAIGAWSWAPSQANQALYITNVALVINTTGGTYRHAPINMAYVAHTYKWARDFNADLRDVLLALIAMALISIPAAFVFSVWWYYHGGGYLKLNADGRGLVGASLNIGVRGLTQNTTLFSLPTWYHATLSLLGIATVFAIHFLRMRLAWFLINPVALAYVVSVPREWFTFLIALTVKSIATKIVGAKRFEEYAAYAAAGLCWGLGSTYLIGALFDLFTSVIPRFYALYVP